MRGGRYGRSVYRARPGYGNEGFTVPVMGRTTEEEMENQGTFGWAIAQMKEGKKLSRMGWNGRDQWVCYMKDTVIPADLINDRTKQFVEAGKDLKVGGYFVMWTSKGVWQPGWLASQADMLADDWGIVDG